MANGDVVLVDVRPAEEFEAGHIDGAQSIPIEELKRRLDEIPATARWSTAAARSAYAHEAVAPCARRAGPRDALKKAGPNGAYQMRRRPYDDRDSPTRHHRAGAAKGMYEEVALEPDREFHFETGRPLAERLGYPPADLDRIPAACNRLVRRGGYFLDLAAIQPGEVVLDLGSGSGTDSFLAALAGGSSGRVIGIDMTEQQLDKARLLAVEGGFGNVDFRAATSSGRPSSPRASTA